MWKIRLNPTKTQATVFSWFKANRYPINRLKIYDQTINWSDHISYLSVTLSNNFTFTSHYASTLNKAKIRMATLRPILKASTLNFESKLAILCTLVFSIFLYAALAIQPSSKLKRFKPYDKFQIRCLRFILNWPRQIPNDLIELVVPITSITDMITRIALRCQRDFIGNHPAPNFF